MSGWLYVYDKYVSIYRKALTKFLIFIISYISYVIKRYTGCNLFLIIDDTI